ncbi:MAG: MarR family transcriptional regulator [Lactobacillus sp.]|jgi:DNA-binding MarR family transcriptional regulator|nr:MarR family transcriptional regulator [Lactobacillus sp.]
MSTLSEKHQLAEKIWEFSILTRLDNDDDRQRGGQLSFSGQGKILILLAQEDNLPQKEIATRLNLTPQSTAEFVAKLARRHYVSKTKSPKDGRVTLIQLTQQGKDALKSIDNTIPSYLEFLNDDEQQQFGQLLAKMNLGLRERIESRDNSINGKMHKVMLQHFTKQTHAGENK